MNPPSSSTLSHDILIVDDTVNNVKLLSEMLTQSGFSVRKAISGQMAIVAINATPPDLILLDINMPEMDGYAVCQHLKSRAETREIPVIFLSASDMTADKVKAFQMGGADYITKPFHAEEVIARIQHQLLLSQLKTDLRSKNLALESALSDLKAAQVELIQKQKMLSLSQLIAGIAHEINNPVNFIMGNLRPAQQYFLNVLNILNLYRQRYPQADQEIDAAIADAELDFIAEDFANVVKSMETGTARICEIVQALQTFSHQGESNIKSVNLKTAIDSVLVLLQPRLREQSNRPSIRVCCNADDLPMVTCDARSINQAILHILDNAIDAIDALWDGSSPELANRSIGRRNPEITITTYQPTPHSIAIAIQDNGIGILDAIKPRVYDPFFTTKSVSQGKGLGLSVAYQIIVNKHQGDLSFTSNFGQGSEFVLEIPVQMPAAACTMQSH
ncbi:MAG: response regulator [Leptolyngbyaceae cyanobacterium T60_A2020_046]|nr:response regulator [Leptolyngbyaceae cyanobacterium T60_A2020_046]